MAKSSSEKSGSGRRARIANTKFASRLPPNQTATSHDRIYSNLLRCDAWLRRALISVLILNLLLTPASAQTPNTHPQPHPRDVSLPLRVTNHCPEPIWPAILTQNGRGPAKTGFVLNPGASNPQTVSGDWRGRVWARTNCTFGNGGRPASGQGGAACQTGDCGMFLECLGAVSHG
jgi:hypothetical protein